MRLKCLGIGDIIVIIQQIGGRFSLFVGQLGQFDLRESTEL